MHTRRLRSFKLRLFLFISNNKIKIISGIIALSIILFVIKIFNDENEIFNDSIYDKHDYSTDYSTQKAIINMQKLVHLDLKGSPPKLKYLIKLLPYFKQIGVTGFLIEYEDMFPYEDKLHIISNLNAYSRQDLDQFLTLVKSNDFIIIPLIQTYGHLEFVLKLNEFKHLREISNHYQVITPCLRETYDDVLFPLVDQIIQFHAKFNIKHIHIGCDEVYHVGKHHQCKSLGLTSTQDYFINHVSKIIDHIKNKNPNLKVIIWDDMIRHNFNLKKLDENKLKSFFNEIELMVWNYNTPIQISRRIWRDYTKVFKRIWIAGAFKGATFQQALMPNVTKHYWNTLNWMSLISKVNKRINFEGMVFTGWSRYDHMQALCELLPAGLPSLVLNLRTLIGFNQLDRVVSDVHDLTKCNFEEEKFGLIMDMDSYDTLKHKKKIDKSKYECNFPSSNLYSHLFELKSLIIYFENKHKTYSSILNEFNLKNGYVNSMSYEYCLNSFYPDMKISFDQMAAKIRSDFMEYFYSDAVEELIEIHIKKYTRIIDNLMSKLRKYPLKNSLNVRP